MSIGGDITPEFFRDQVYQFAMAEALTGFDTLLDSAVFHCIGDDAAQRRYLAAVTPRCKMDATAVMLVFSDKNPDPSVGPRRIS